MLLTFFVTAAILAGLGALEESASGSRWQGRAMWSAIALAVLARITWTIVDIAGAGIGFWLGKGRIGNEQDAI